MTTANPWLKWIVGLGVLIVIGALVLAFLPSPAQGVAVGGHTDINGVSIVVLNLVEDSRCPVDVQCIQAGTVRVRVALNTFNRDFTFTLNEPQEVEGKMITLTSVSPTVKYSKVTVDPSDYRFIFTVN